MAKKKKKILTIDQLVSNYNKFIKGKEINNAGKDKFEQVIKKAGTTKQPSAK